MASLMTSRLINFRASYPDKQQFFDVRYSELIKDPIVVVKVS